MKLLKGIGTGLCLSLLCLAVAPKAKADDWDRKSIITFSAPVEVPGVGQHLLPAGTYVFKIFNSPSNRHIVQVFSQDESQLLTTILAIPNFRLKVNDKVVMTFNETPTGEPPALKAWFYPGHQYGEHFVYSKSRAMELAKLNNETILATPAPLDTAKADDLNTVPVEAVTPQGETVETAKVVEAPPEPAPVAVVAAPERVVAPPVEVASLPKTASYLPLIGLLGFLALGVGFVLTGLSKRIA
jgi:hypothetical protein